MKPTSRTFKTLAILIAGGIVLNWLLTNFDFIGTILSTVWGILYPFVLGFVIAFLLNLPMRFIEAKLFRGRGGRARRPISFISSLLLVLGAIVLVVWLVVPELWKTVMQLTANMPGYIQSLEKSLQPYAEYIPAIQEWLQNLDVDWASLVKQITELLSSGAGDFFSSAFSVATSIAGGVFSLFIGIIFACYLLLDKEHLTGQFHGLLEAYMPEKKYEKVTQVGRLTSRTFANFISGQCLEAVLLTVVYLLILVIGGFDYALLIAVVIGFFSLIPMIGAYIGCFVGVFLLWVSMGFWRAVAFVIIMIVVQQIEGNFIYPHVIGSSVGLPPVWMLVAVTVGGSLAGIFGMMFFIPLFSVIYTLVHKDATARLAAKGIASPVSELPAKPRRKHRTHGTQPPDPDEAAPSTEAEKESDETQIVVDSDAPENNKKNKEKKGNKSK